MGVIAGRPTRTRTKVAPEKHPRRGVVALLAASLLAPALLALSAGPSTAGAATTAVFPVVQANATGAPPSAWSTAIRSAGTGMRKAAGPLRSTSTAAGKPAVFGLSSQAKVLELVADGANGRSWNTYALSTLTGTGPVNPGVAPLLEPGGALDVFAVTTAGHLVERPEALDGERDVRHARRGGEPDLNLRCHRVASLLAYSCPFPLGGIAESSPYSPVI